MSVARARALVERYGWNTTSFQTLEPHFRYWFREDGEGMVAYYDLPTGWIAAGAPIAAPEKVAETAAGFIRNGEQKGKSVSFFGIHDRGVALLGDRVESVKVGEQPWWDPQLWQERHTVRREVASQIRRAERKGVGVRSIAPERIADPGSPERRAAEGVMRAWSRSRPMSAMGFLVYLDPFTFSESRRYFLAEQDGQAVGFLALVPIHARNGWFLEDLLRTPDAPNGTAEMLVDAAMRSIAADGARYATLGMVPLKGFDSSPLALPRWGDLLFRFARRYMSAFYRFEGLAAFKSKFHPEGWENIYLAGAPRVTPLTLLSTLLAFARARPIRFALATLLQMTRQTLEDMKPALWRRLALLFAGTLLIWIVVLALADAAHWFGAEWIRTAWVIFDLAMAGIFLLIGIDRVGRPGQVQVIALIALGATLTDLLVTAVQVVSFHFLRSPDLLEVAVGLLGVLGPALASLFFAGLAVASRSWRR
jgi:phosphatidylglycerol lysyltransferase